jgi:hypothetical protein
MMEEFGFGKEVATLTVSLFVAGYCLGPLVWGPLSEDVSCLELFCSWFVFNSPPDWSPTSLPNNVPG